MTLIAETERLTLRELDSAVDAEFVFELLNSPKFLRYIGDRGVRSVDQSAQFIENRYRESYRDNGFGLYVVELNDTATPVGICGFVKRQELTHPDIGFAMLPAHESNGYGYEAARAVLEFGSTTLGIKEVLAITTQENDASGRLLEKLGFRFVELRDVGGETLKVFSNFGSQ